jgi:hypothetical protein
MSSFWESMNQAIDGAMAALSNRANSDTPPDPVEMQPTALDMDEYVIIDEATLTVYMADENGRPKPETMPVSEVPFPAFVIDGKAYLADIERVQLLMALDRAKEEIRAVNRPRMDAGMWNAIPPKFKENPDKPPFITGDFEMEGECYDVL